MVLQQSCYVFSSCWCLHWKVRPFIVVQYACCFPHRLYRILSISPSLHRCKNHPPWIRLSSPSFHTGVNIHSEPCLLRRVSFFFDDKPWIAHERLQDGSICANSQGAEKRGNEYTRQQW
jgi:hypothetical protein